MKHASEFDKGFGVCVINVSGIHKRPEDSQALLRIAGAFAQAHRCSSFLFDMRETTLQGSILGAFETAVDPEEHGFSRSHRIAAVYPTLTKDHKFMETVGVNRGATAFRVFDDIDHAREWLGMKNRVMK